MVIAERIPFHIDNKALWNEVAPLLKVIPPAQRSPAVAGWTLQAPIGSTDPLHSGWGLEFCPYNGPDNRSPSWTPRDDEERSMKSVQDFIAPTELCTPLFKVLLQDLSNVGLWVRRARIIKLSANSKMQWHVDGSRHAYQVRLHIPLVTNSSSYFETEGGRVHMAIDQSLYFVHINRLHRATNEGEQDRYHFVAHVWDINGFTLDHRYDPRICDFETIHPEDIGR